MANPNEATPNTESAKVEVAKLDLPSVESPSISPADLVTVTVSEPVPEIAPETAPMIEPVAAVAVPVAEPVVAAAPAVEPAAESGIQIIWPTFNVPKLTPRHKRHALLAASVAIVGALGAVIGAAASGGFAPKPAPLVNVATADDRKALEQSIARLTSQVTTLKASLDATNKAAHAQIAKISERADRIERNASAELVTGSISAPQTVPAAAAPVPVPTPRPAPRIAAPEIQQAPSRPQIVQDWAIREARDGYVYVQGHGDVFQVVAGAPLPGLGPVESIRRQDGRWVVTTPKGIIVSMRDRRYFE
jgi:hypothetical protein